ncbi:efflux transporter outer membrane subunit [Ravibacter arvi]|uniref:Efflux transporter outer membrane subunit n=1 Tax=Ravibacter arvi TaxID=2051041 RepID=A0ABP8LW80_9BACT
MKYNPIISITLLVLAGCRPGKEQLKPDVALPQEFRVPAGQEARLEGGADSLNRTLPSLSSFFNNQTLRALIDSALVNNNDLRSAIKNIELARTTMRQVKLNYLPDIDAQLAVTRNKSARNSFAGLGNEAFIGRLSVNDFNLNLGVNWEIDIWGRVKTQKEEALSVFLQNQEIKKGIQTRLVADIASGYYNLLMLDEQLRIARNSQQLADSTLTIINAQYRVGEASLLAIQQSKAQLDAARQLVPQIEQSIVQQENAVGLLAGQYAKAIIRNPEQEGEFNIDPKSGYDVSLLAARPDVQQAEFNFRAANARAGLAQIAMYPRLTITAQGGLTSFNVANWIAFPGSVFWNAAGGLTQPVFQRRQLKTAYEQAVIEQEKAAIGFKQAVLTGYAEVSSALVANRKLEEQLAIATDRRQSLSEGIGSAKILFKNGEANYLEIIAAQSSYLQSRLDVTLLEREKANAIIELYRALGGGWK